MKKQLAAGIRFVALCAVVVTTALTTSLGTLAPQARELTRPTTIHATRSANGSNVDPASGTIQLNPSQERQSAVPDRRGRIMRHTAESHQPAMKPVYIYSWQRVAIPASQRRLQLASRSGRSFTMGGTTYERRKVATDISPLILRYAKLRKLDPFLVKAVIHAESNFDPNATSWVGAAGLMQLMPGTGAEMGARDLYDPEQNIAAGTRYLSLMMGIYKGRVDLALAAYNAGPGNVGSYVPAIPETQNYVVKVTRAYKEFLKEKNAE